MHSWIDTTKMSKSSKKRAKRARFMRRRNSNIAVYKIQIARRKAKSRSKSNKGRCISGRTCVRLRLVHSKTVNILSLCLYLCWKSPSIVKSIKFAARSCPSDRGRKQWTKASWRRLRRRLKSNQFQSQLSKLAARCIYRCHSPNRNAITCNS